MVFFPLLNNFKALDNQLIHAIDFSIYQEAIYKIAKTGSLNPYLNIRDVKIFNDHVDPIIILASVFVKIFGYTAKNLLLFEFLFYAGIFIFFLKKSKLELKDKFIGCLMILLTKGILSGLLFPIHPTTWAMLPCFILFFYVFEDDENLVLFTSLVLVLFRESFAFNIIMLSFYYLIRKNLKLFTGLLLISIGSLLFTYLGRSVFFEGERINYAGRLLGPFFKSPLTAFINLFLELDYKSYLKVLGPFIVSFIFLFKNYKLKEFKLMAPLFFIAPSIGIFILNRSIGYQYGAHVCAPLLAGILYYGKESIFNDKKALSIILVVFLATGMGRYTRMFKFLILDKSKSTEISYERRKSYQEKVKFLRDKDEIVTNGMLAPGLVNGTSAVYEIGYFSPKRDKYNYALLLNPEFGDSRPISNEYQNLLIEKCSKTSRVLQKDKYFLLLTDLSGECVDLINRNAK